MPPLFFAKFSEILRKNPNFLANYQQITSKLKCNNLIYNKIKILFFFIKKCCNYKKNGIFAMSNNNKKNKNKEQWKQQKELQKLLKEMY